MVEQSDSPSCLVTCIRCGGEFDIEEMIRLSDGEDVWYACENCFDEVVK